jgi:TolB protein
MDVSNHTRTGTRAFQTVLTGLLVAALTLFTAGCGGAGANGGDGTGDGDDGGDDGGGGDTTAPAAPGGFSGESMDSAINLTWGAVDADDLDGYNVYRDTESGVDASGDPLESGLSETGYTDEGAENGTTYYYVVTAVDTADNESDPSGEVERTPFDSPPDRP